jgi:hypothetical protein
MANLLGLVDLIRGSKMSDRDKILLVIAVSLLVFSALHPSIVPTLAFESRPPTCGPSIGQPCLPEREPIPRDAKELDDVVIGAPIQVAPIAPAMPARRIARGGARTWRR